jgi:cytochrome c oxidase assembly protein subunit 15
MTTNDTRAPDRVLGSVCIFALVWAAVVFQAGGFTTTIGAGMAFLDWPLSNGSINPPGWLTNLDRFAEHSHRLAAFKLGIIALGIAVLHLLREPRQGVRLLAYGLVGLIVIQAGLGGLRVVLDQLNTGAENNLGGIGFGIAHAVMAQLTVATLACLLLVHTRVWHQDALIPSPWAQFLARLAPLLLLAVMVAAAVMRQNRVTLWTSGGDVFIPAVGEGWVWTVNLLHRAGALFAAAGVIALAVAGSRSGAPRALVITLIGALVLQITLGILALGLPQNPHPRTLHVIVGAVLFCTTCSLALLLLRAARARTS